MNILLVLSISKDYQDHWAIQNFDIFLGSIQTDSKTWPRQRKK